MTDMYHKQPNQNKELALFLHQMTQDPELKSTSSASDRMDSEEKSGVQVESDEDPLYISEFELECPRILVDSATTTLHSSGLSR